MTVVWEEPPKGGWGGGTRERSPLRKEIDSMLDELRQRPGQWARLWDFQEKEEAEKRANVLRSVSGKGWNVSLRQTQYGWSIFSRRREDEAEEDTERAATF
jgi:hypothetical protein